MNAIAGCQFNGVNKYFYALFILLLAGSCQPKQETVALRVGGYYTEEEAIEKLNEYALTYNNAAEWNLRAQKIRDNIVEGAQLKQIPKEDWEFPIAITKRNRQVMDGYTVENLALEVRPGHFITGNLYMPDTIQGKIPAVLCPHGHWQRANDYGRFRRDMQFRSASLARMGAVVFSYDMFGYGEDVGHEHRHPMTLKWQTYNGIRILDFISDLEYVDTGRIAVTGASGGGTQTFLLAALDERVAVSVPVVMVSAHFFGGCVCESGLPIHEKGTHETNNVEIAATFAPKPLLLISDGDDWTKNVPEVEYPYIKNIYSLFGTQQNVQYAHFEDEVHDYGPSKRKPMYEFLAKHLSLDLSRILDQDGLINEGFVQLLDTTSLKVFPDRSLVPAPKPN